MTATPEKKVAPSKCPPAPGTGPQVRLTVAGPNGPVRRELEQAVTLIGGRRDCDLTIADPAASKIHCAIVHDGHQLLICDLCSRSGTYVNDQPVRVHALQPGDAIRAGPVAIEVEYLAPSTAGGDAADEPPPPPPIALGNADVDVSAGVALLGRRTTCDVVIDTPDVSPVHALLFTFDGRPAVCDLGSRSGTYLNGARVQLAWVYDGQRLGIGGEELIVQCEAAPPPPLTMQARATDPVGTPGSTELDGPLGAAAASDPEAVGTALRSVLCDAAALEAAFQRDVSGDTSARDALALLLQLHLDHIESLKTDLCHRAVQAEEEAEEARKRLDVATKREGALTAAWEELERWQTALQERRRDLVDPPPPAEDPPPAPAS